MPASTKCQVNNPLKIINSRASNRGNTVPTSKFLCLSFVDQPYWAHWPTQITCCVKSGRRMGVQTASWWWFQHQVMFWRAVCVQGGCSAAVWLWIMQHVPDILKWSGSRMTNGRSSIASEAQFGHTPRNRVALLMAVDDMCIAKWLAWWDECSNHWHVVTGSHSMRPFYTSKIMRVSVHSESINRVWRLLSCFYI